MSGRRRGRWSGYCRGGRSRGSGRRSVSEDADEGILVGARLGRYRVRRGAHRRTAASSAPNHRRSEA